MSADAAPTPKKAPSQARIDANSRNAKLSTGPKSPAGKAASSRNAHKHGFCARVVAVPGEDPGLYAERFDAWRPSLNPKGDAFADYLVSLAASTSLALDRVHAAQSARSARRAREAGPARDEAATRRVERLLKRLRREPGAVLRRLRATAAGCRALLAEWDALADALDPADRHWDFDDVLQLGFLVVGSASGDHDSALGEAASDALGHYREAARMVRSGGWVDWPGYGLHDGDAQAKLAALAARVEAAVPPLLAALDAHRRALRDRLAELEPAEAADRAEAPIRDAVDTSDEGRLMRRYEAEHRRELLRLAAAARAQSLAAGNDSQVVSEEGVAEEGPPDVAATSAPAVPRNEPNPAARSDPDRSPVRPSDDPGWGRPTADRTPKDRPDRR